MNKKKLLVLLSAIIMTFGIFSTECTVSSQPVQAITRKQRRLVQRSIHYHTVKLTKRIAVRKIHKRIPTYKSTLGPKKYLKKGTKVRILQLGTDFGWYIKARGLHGNYTVVRRMSDFSWFKF